jgi:hypothetical protein
MALLRGINQKQSRRKHWFSEQMRIVMVAVSSIEWYSQYRKARDAFVASHQLVS